VLCCVVAQDCQRLLSEANTELGTLRPELTAFQTQLKACNKSLSETKFALDGECAARKRLADELDAVTGQHSKAVGVSSSLQRELIAARAACDQTAAKLSATSAALEHTRAELSSAHAANAEATKEIGARVAAEASLREELSAREQRLEAARRAAAEADRTIEAKTEEIVAQTATIEECRGTCNTREQLTAQRSTARVADHSLCAVLCCACAGELSELSAQLAGVRANLSALTVQKGSVDESLATLTGRFEKLTAEHTATVATLNATDKSLAGTQATLAQTQANLQAVSPCSRALFPVRRVAHTCEPFAGCVCRVKRQTLTCALSSRPVDRPPLCWRLV
jgi:chromosome segregation ATPase